MNVLLLVSGLDGWMVASEDGDTKVKTNRETRMKSVIKCWSRLGLLLN